MRQQIGRPLRRAAVGLRTRGWPDHSRLFLVYDVEGWVLEYEARQLERTARALGVAIGPGGWSKGVDRQAIFHLSQFTLLLHDFERRENRLGFAYFHGRPGTPGMPEFDACFETLRRRHAEIDRVQVTSSAMEELILETGIASEKLHRIPIGIDTEAFRPRTPHESRGCPPRARASRVRVRRGLVPEGRRRLGRRAGAEADQGPGRAARRRRAAARTGAGIVFLLTGPSRGYVRAGLERLGIPLSPRSASRHRRRLAGVRGHRRLPRHLARRGRTARGSRSHGDRGPARDDARRAGARPRAHGKNGWIVDVEDVDGLVEMDGSRRGGPRDELDGRAPSRASRPLTRTRTSALRPRWRELFDGFVAHARTAGERMDVSSERIARYTRAGSRWTRLLDRRQARTWRTRLLRPRPRSGARRAGGRRNGEGAEAERAVSEQPDATSRCSTSARPGFHATCVRCSPSRGVAGFPSS